MFDLYTASKCGPMNQQAYTGVATRVKLIPPRNNQRTLFLLRPSTACHVLQGGSAVTATATTAVFIAAGQTFPLVTENELDSYISIIRDVTNGTLDITIASSVEAWTLAAA